jgi:hypothetical protein
MMPEAETTENLNPIFTYSPFTNMEALLQQFEYIKKTGTRIVIFNLRKDGNFTEFFHFTFLSPQVLTVLLLSIRKYARV